MSEDLQSFTATGRLTGNASVSTHNGETLIKFRISHNADTKKTAHGTKDITVIFSVELRADSSISSPRGISSKTASYLKKGTVVTVSGTLVPVIKGGKSPGMSWKIKANRVSFPYGAPAGPGGAERAKGRRAAAKASSAAAFDAADDADREDVPPPPPPGAEESRTWAWQDDDGIWWSRDKVWWYDRIALKWRAASDYVKPLPMPDDEFPF